MKAIHTLLLAFALARVSAADEQHPGRDLLLPVCSDATGSPSDEGAVDDYRGYYDVTSCGNCNFYCRWIGASGSGGNPAIRTTFRDSSWSCEGEGELLNSIPKFRYPRCQVPNDKTPQTQVTSALWNKPAKVIDVGPNPLIGVSLTLEPSASPTTLSPTDYPVARTYEVIFTEGFDSGMGPYFIDADGSRSRDRFDDDFARGGSGQSVRIKDDSDDSALYSVDINVQDYGEVIVSFYYDSEKVEEGEGFYFETKNSGGVWEKRDLFLLGTAWPANEGGWNLGLVEFSVMDIDYVAIKLCGFDLGSMGYIYIDDVTVSGK
jgi:hypothetical protein